MPHTSYRRRLPHWRQEGGTYFVTWRLQRRQAPLRPAERTVVLQTLRVFDGPRFHLLAAVVMDDHVHVIVQPLPGNRLERIVQGWKSASARALAVGERVGGCWQREYYDRLIRSDRALFDTLAYIQNNPRRRWPGITGYPWLYTSTPLVPTREPPEMQCARAMLGRYGARLPLARHPWRQPAPSTPHSARAMLGRYGAMPALAQHP